MTNNNTIFTGALAWDERLGYYKNIWACPLCGELHIMPGEPLTCHHCGYKRPGRSDEEGYAKAIEESRAVALGRILCYLGMTKEEESPSVTRCDTLAQEGVYAREALINQFGYNVNQAKTMIKAASRLKSDASAEELVLLAIKKVGT